MKGTLFTITIWNSARFYLQKNPKLKALPSHFKSGRSGFKKEKGNKPFKLGDRYLKAKITYLNCHAQEQTK